MVIRELLNVTIASLKLHNNTNAIFEAHLIVRTVLEASPLDLVLHAKEEVSESLVQTIIKYTKRRNTGEPLQYILGTQEFMSLEFIVTPDVLIPRSDTETLVEYILKKKSNCAISVLDIGTGSGCIAVSIAYYNKHAYVRGIDISLRSLNIAQQNAKKHHVNDRVLFERQNIMSDTLYGRYDVIVSNPPYIESDVVLTLDTNVKDFEPTHALDGGPDGLDFYRRIVSAAPAMLNEYGLLVFEVGHTQAKAVSKLMESDFSQIEIIKDLCGIDRVVSGIAAKK